MKKLILIIPFIFFTCSEPRESKMEIFTDSSLSTDSISVLDKAEAALQHTEGLEEEIQETYKTKETLLKGGLVKTEAKGRKGEKNSKAKLTDEKVKEIIDLTNSKKYLQKEIAEMYNVGRQTIRRITQKKLWKHIN